MKSWTVSLAAKGIALALALASCNESDPGLQADTGTDGTPDADAVVSTCALVADWSLGLDQDSTAAGTVSGTATLDSGGTASSCAGPPCLVVTVITGGGTVTGITQESTNVASFTYANADLGPGGEAQLLLRWRVLCTSDSGGNEERTVSLPAKVCSDTAGALSLVEGSCP